MTDLPLHKSRTSPAVMVVHGPEAFDHGDVAWILNRISPKRVIVAGVMARTAAEESGLDVEFDSRPPSRVIAEIAGPVFLACRSKSPESAHAFGSIIASRLGGKGLVQAECSTATVITWDSGESLLSLGLAGLFGYDSEDAKSSSEPAGTSRLIRGCIPGEPVFVNGIVIGRATADTIEIRQNDGQIEIVRGLEPKVHGIAKLCRSGPVDLSTAWCKSGIVRRAKPSGGGNACSTGRVIVIDHCGHEMYNRLNGDCCGVVAIGDDTTAVCGHICLHRGIPVLGITDLDSDTILPSAFAPGTVLLDSRPERDDDLGAEIAGWVPDSTICWDTWVGEVLARLDGRGTIALDLRSGRI